jgi:hypothetical protein
MKHRKVSFNKLVYILMILEVIILCFIGWEIYSYHQTSNQVKLDNNANPKQTSCSISGVPAQFCTRAKQDGYYCPSWDAKPGQIAPDICYKVK